MLHDKTHRITQNGVQKMEYREVLILGRPYIQATLWLVKTRTRAAVKGGEKIYERYIINVPPELGKKLNPRGEKKVPILAYLTRPWIHQLIQLDPEDPIYRNLPTEAKVELYYQGLDPLEKPRGTTVFIAAEEEKIKQLGLDPTKPITIDDIIEAIHKQLLTEFQENKKGKMKEPLTASPRT